MATKYPNLEAVRAVTDPGERARAVQAYLDERMAALEEARTIRHDAIRELLQGGAGVTETARRAGVSLSLVKGIRLSMKENGK
jgi:hypothetical protein